jgi:KR domain
MNIDGWRKAVDPKLKGSLNLHEVFSRGCDLDFFILTSSISATLGSAGQANYAAGKFSSNQNAKQASYCSLPAKFV